MFFEKNKLYLAIKDIFVNTSLQKKNNKYNYLALAIAAGMGHIAFGFYWTYIDPQIYESFILRTIGFIICAILLSTFYWSPKFQKFIYPFWIFAIIYNLPFFYTVNLIRNEFSDIWFVAQAGVIFIVILFLTNIIPSIIAIFTGILLAVLFCLITAPDMVYFNQDIITHMPIYMLTLIASYIFSYSNSKGLAVAQQVVHEQKQQLLKSLSHSIAHELRNPLNSINFSISELQNVIPENPVCEKDISINHTIQSTKKTITRTSKLIDMLLDNVKNKELDPESFIYISTNKILETALAEYGYSSKKEKELINIIINQEQDFIFKGDEDAFIYVIFNLIKNALYYKDAKPNHDFKIDITTKDEEKFNIISIKDNGIGIPSNKLESIFESFFTSGKKGGTGLGLPFCKRVLNNFGGDIYCNSELGKWTEFVIQLPKLSSKKLEEAKIAMQQQQEYQKPISILYVDDEKVNLLTIKSLIENNLGNFSVTITHDGFEAIKMVKETSYDAILMDLEMPGIDGYKTTAEIKKINPDIPVISYTSLENVRKKVLEEGFEDYLTKLSPKDLLFKTICKWSLTRYQSPSHKEITKDQIKEILANKVILFAEDEDMSRMLISQNLKKYGLKVETAKHGQELIDKFIDSEDQIFDLILTDINMPLVKGYDAAKKIKEYIYENKLKNIPIIAFMGDDDQEDIFNAFRSGIDDYHIKGKDIQYLIQTILFWIVIRDEEKI